MRASMNMWKIATAMLIAVGGFALNAGAADAAVAKGSVKGKVVKTDGTPAAGVEVRLMARPDGKAKAAKNEANPAAPADKGAARRPARELTAHGTTNAQGEFTLSDVPAGNYTLTARLKGTGNARRNVTVHGTSASDVNLTLKERAAGKKVNKQAVRRKRKPVAEPAKAAQAEAAARRTAAPQS